METLSKSTQDTKELARGLAKKLKPGDVLALYGDLGSGKTTFTAFLVEALGIPARVQSPTFVVVRKYEGGKGLVKTVNHIDLYRLTDQREVEDIGIEELIAEKDHVAVIEWPELAEGYLPDGTIKIYFDYLEENSRRINVSD
jgi:tRNA threonylcarbamoyladenosine biosynthesis protein TsaE